MREGVHAGGGGGIVRCFYFINTYLSIHNFLTENIFYGNSVYSSVAMFVCVGQARLLRLRKVVCLSRCIFTKNFSVF